MTEGPGHLSRPLSHVDSASAALVRAPTGGRRPRRARHGGRAGAGVGALVALARLAVALGGDRAGGLRLDRLAVRVADDLGLGLALVVVLDAAGRRRRIAPPDAPERGGRRRLRNPGPR